MTSIETIQRMIDAAPTPELVKRLEEARGPDRELDFAISKALALIPAEAEWKPLDADDPMANIIAAFGNNGWALPSFVAEQRAWKRRLDEFIGSPEYFADKDGTSWVRDNPSPGVVTDWKNDPPEGHVTAYTASIDAALALVERKLEDSAYSLLNDYAGFNQASINVAPGCIGYPNGGLTVKAQAATMPLAILMALLRALSTEPK